LTLNFDTTCFMTSPRVIALPSLPAFDKSIAERVKESVWRFCLTTVGLIRGPDDAPQAGCGGRAIAAEGAKEGKAASSNLTDRDCLRSTGPAASGREGNGSGAPSSSCFLYTRRSYGS
jgi:hypothetical protein